MFVFGTADDVFTMAVRIEENGFAFYSGVSEMYADEKLKNLFRDLAGMEQGHIKAFKVLRGELPVSVAAQVWDPEGLAENYLQASADDHIFTLEAAKERLKKVLVPQDALDMALQFEKDSVAFFVGMKEMLPDADGKNQIDQLIRSEMGHINMLNQAKKDLAGSGHTKIV